MSAFSRLPHRPLPGFLACLSRPGRRRPARGKPLVRRRLTCELLEDRRLLTVVTPTIPPTPVTDTVVSLVSTDTTTLTTTAAQPTIAGGQGSLDIQGLNQGATATTLVQALIGTNAGTISNVQLTANPGTSTPPAQGGTSSSAGLFSDGANIIGINSGVILSTGGVQSVIGPNTGTVPSQNNNLPGSPALSNLTGTPTTDATTLSFNLVPTANTVTFQYVFASSQYGSNITAAANDVFALGVNGQNVATVPGATPGTTAPVSVATINPQNNSQLLINNLPEGQGASQGNASTTTSTTISTTTTTPTSTSATQAHGPLNINMNGLTTVLTATATLIPNQTNHIVLSIADGASPAGDSNVFVTGSVSDTAPTVSSLQITGPQVQPSADGSGNVTVPQGATITVSGTVTSPNPTSALKAQVTFGDGSSQVVTLTPTSTSSDATISTTADITPTSSSPTGAAAISGTQTLTYTFTATHTYPIIQTGAQPVTVNVMDAARQTASSTAQVNIVDVPPTVSPLRITGPQVQPVGSGSGNVTTSQGATITVSGIVTSPDPTSLLTTEVSFGDGSSQQVTLKPVHHSIASPTTSANTPTSALSSTDFQSATPGSTNLATGGPAGTYRFTVSHTYAFSQTGVQPVTVSVTDAAQQTGSNSAQVSIVDVPPVVSPLQLAGDPTVTPPQVLASSGSTGVTAAPHATVFGTGTVTSIDPLTTLIAQVNFGDGQSQQLTLTPVPTATQLSAVTGAAISTPSSTTYSFAFSHAYPTTPGLYPMTVSVTDAAQQTGSSTAGVNVLTPTQFTNTGQTVITTVSSNTTLVTVQDTTSGDGLAVTTTNLPTGSEVALTTYTSSPLGNFITVTPSGGGSTTSYTPQASFDLIGTNADGTPITSGTLPAVFTAVYSASAGNNVTLLYQDSHGNIVPVVDGVTGTAPVAVITPGPTPGTITATFNVTLTANSSTPTLSGLSGTVFTVAVPTAPPPSNNFNTSPPPPTTPPPVPTPPPVVPPPPPPAGGSGNGNGGSSGAAPSTPVASAGGSTTTVTVTSPLVLVSSSGVTASDAGGGFSQSVILASNPTATLVLRVSQEAQASVSQSAVAASGTLLLGDDTLNNLTPDDVDAFLDWLFGNAPGQPAQVGNLGVAPVQPPGNAPVAAQASAPVRLPVAPRQQPDLRAIGAVFADPTWEEENPTFSDILPTRQGQAELTAPPAGVPVESLWSAAVLVGITHGTVGLRERQQKRQAFGW